MRRTLFKLPYGNASNSVGLEPKTGDAARSEGPSELVADSAGNLVIGDYANRRILKFGPLGNLLMSAQVENLNLIAIDNQTGAVYVLGGGALDRVWKLGLSGKPLFSIKPKDFLSNEDLKELYVIEAIYVGSDGTLYVSVRGSSAAVIEFDVNGNFLGLVKAPQSPADELANGLVPSPSGHLIVLGLANRDFLHYWLSILDRGGRPLAKARTSPVPADRTLFNGSEGAIGGAQFDSGDNIYTITDSERGPDPEDQGKKLARPTGYHGPTKPGPPPFAIKEGLKVRADIVVTKCNSAGTPVAQLRFAGSPTNDICVAVDPAGNIYHLAFSPKGVTVVKYELSNPAAGQPKASAGLQIIQEPDPQ